MYRLFRIQKSTYLLTAFVNLVKVKPLCFHYFEGGGGGRDGGAGAGGGGGFTDDDFLFVAGAGGGGVGFSITGAGGLFPERFSRWGIGGK